MFLHGACRQAVKTSDCDSDMRGFESHHAPQFGRVANIGLRAGLIHQ